MITNHPLIVICGLHRSGTTFVGEILRQDGNIPIIHEPLNQRFGVEGVPIAYPFVDETGTAECAEYARLIEEAACFSMPWNRSTKYIKAQGLKRMLYALTGGRRGVFWDSLRLRRAVGLMPQRVCWKDPFVTLATPYLLNSMGVRVVCLLRHPAAIHVSTHRQNWWFDVSNLLRQPLLIRKYASDIPPEHWEMARTKKVASLALLWKIAMRVNIPLAGKDDRLLLVRHEDLCQNPEEVAENIMKHFGLFLTRDMRRYVKAMSSGSSAEAEDGKVHSFRRDSKALMHSWRGKISISDEEILRVIIGDDLTKFYFEW